MKKLLPYGLLSIALAATVTLPSCLPTPKDKKEYDEADVEIEEVVEQAPTRAPAKMFKRGNFGQTRAVRTDADLAGALEYGNVVIDFWAPWCGPCKQLTPVLERMAGKYPHVLFVKVNTEDSPSIGNKYGVRSLPTLLFLRDGKKVHTETGYAGASVVDTAIQKYFG